MVRTTKLKNYSDVHFTNRDVARKIVEFFHPKGKILEPFRGDGAFFDSLPPGSEWCEISEGRNFFDWNEQVDWIITNPPFSDLTEIMSHAFKVSENTVFLVPLSKIYSSSPRLQLVNKVAGIKTQLILGPGRQIGFDIGFPFAAMHFQRGYQGMTETIWD